MANELTAAQERELKKGINERLNLIRKMGSGRKLGHLANVENPNRRVQKGAAEEAIAGLHRNHASGREIRKSVTPAMDAGAMAISRMHGDPATFADRNVSGNRDLVQKLAGVLVEAVTKDYSSAKQARRELRKLIETGSSADQPRPKTHEVVKSGRGKAGAVVLLEKRGADYPFVVEVDGYHHSAYPDADRAEKCFARLTA